MFRIFPLRQFPSTRKSEHNANAPYCPSFSHSINVLCSANYLHHFTILGAQISLTAFRFHSALNWRERRFRLYFLRGYFERYFSSRLSMSRHFIAFASLLIEHNQRIIQISFFYYPDEGDNACRCNIVITK